MLTDTTLLFGLTFTRDAVSCHSPFSTQFTSASHCYIHLLYKFNKLSESHHLCPGKRLPVSSETKPNSNLGKHIKFPNMCKESGRICVVVQQKRYLIRSSPHAETPGIIYTAGMQDYYILRLHKDLRIALEKERNRLYALCGDRSLLTWEPCIILGPATGKTAQFIPSPPLPVIVSGTARYTNGILHLPLADSTALDRTRESLQTSWPIHGIFLGTVDIEYERAELALRSLSFAVMETTGSSWRIGRERRLHSDIYR